MGSQKMNTQQLSFYEVYFKLAIYTFDDAIKHEEVNCPSFASTVKLFSSPTIFYKFIPDVFQWDCQGLMHVEKLFLMVF